MMNEPCENLQRRALLQEAVLLALTPSVLLSGCSDAQRSSGAEPVSLTPFSTHFSTPGQGRVRLDFQDDENFSVTPDFGPGSTIAHKGQIYFHFAPSISTFNRSRLLWVGALAASSNAGASNAKRVSLKAAKLPRSQTVAWNITEPIFKAKSLDATRPQPADGQAPEDWWVASISTLARAQHAVGVRMRNGMDMALCGDAVSQLVATWPEALTAKGLAVLAHSSGAQLAEPIGPLGRSVTLPGDVELEDFRLRRS